MNTDRPPDLSGDMSTGEWSPEVMRAREERRVIAAARWYVRCVEFGLRTDCSWFELRAAVKAIAPEEVADDDAA